MGYDYLVRLILSESDLKQFDDITSNELIQWSNDLRAAYIKLSARETFPIIGRKDRGYYSCGPEWWDKYDINTPKIKLTDELILLSIEVPKLKFYALYYGFDLTYAILYQLYNGTVSELGNIDLPEPTYKIGPITFNSCLCPEDSEIEYELQNVLDGKETLVAFKTNAKSLYLNLSYE